MRVSRKKKIGHAVSVVCMTVVVVIVLFPILWAMPAMFKKRNL